MQKRHRKGETTVRNGLALSLAAALIGGSSLLAVAQQAPVVNRGGGIAGTGLGAGAGTAGVQGAAPLGNKARSPAVIGGTAHIGAGTGGVGRGMGNAAGGLNEDAIGAGSGGILDRASWGSSTGGINGVGRGLGVGSGGINDTPGAGTGINTGGIVGSSIGAGTGGLHDLNNLGAGTGGTNEGNNAPRFRVVQ
jgi:hypothetical protein